MNPRYKQIIFVLVVIGMLIPIVSAGYVLRNRSVETIAPIETSRMSNITTGLHLTNTSENGTPPEFTSVISESVGVYTDALGPLALVIFFLIPFSSMWIANRSMKGPAILGIIVSGFVFMYLPANYTAGAILCMAVSAIAFIYSLVKQQN